ncbi:MAG TPA: tetratricopeptide repeat protein, partial [Ignavibacteriaceae bacterium]|nr:tetratricopeptide repeat protein [Ignavibacteriaceae bacterium]
FNDNYNEIIETAEKNKIPIIISTLVTNEKDLAPFVSMHSSTLDKSQKKSWLHYYNLGLNSLKKNNYNDAIHHFENAVSIDSTPANVHYQLGKCYQQLGNYERAKRKFLIAKDLDGLRFRAPSEFNNVIKKLVKKYKIPLADVNKNFQENSPNGIIGDELLIDHLHPNIPGYFLLAKSWFEAIQEHKIFKFSLGHTYDDNILLQNSSFSILDSVIGELKIMKLRNEPPFSSVRKNFDFTAKNFSEQIAYDYVIKQQTSWGKAHLLAAQEYMNKNDFVSALKEYKAILVTDENNPYILSSTGDIYFNLELYKEAEENYLKAFAMLNEPSLKFKLGMTYINLQKPKTAIQFLKDCLINNPGRFNPEEIEKIHYNFALAYIQLNEIDNAINKLNFIIKNNPLNNEAKTLLNKISN